MFLLTSKSLKSNLLTASNKQIDIGGFGPFHIGGHTADGHTVQQFLTPHAHYIH